LVKEGAQIIDARSTGEYAGGHIRRQYQYSPTRFKQELKTSKKATNLLLPVVLLE
jgi:rhodanese-related sulfurtransferase